MCVLLFRSWYANMRRPSRSTYNSYSFHAISLFSSRWAPMCVCVFWCVLKRTERHIYLHMTQQWKSQNTHHAFKRFPPSYSEKPLERDRPIRTYAQHSVGISVVFIVAHSVVFVALLFVVASLPRTLSMCEASLLHKHCQVEIVSNSIGVWYRNEYTNQIWHRMRKHWCDDRCVLGMLSKKSHEIWDNDMNIGLGIEFSLSNDFGIVLTHTLWRERVSVRAHTQRQQVKYQKTGKTKRCFCLASNRQLMVIRRRRSERCNENAIRVQPVASLGGQIISNLMTTAKEKHERFAWQKVRTHCLKASSHKE